MLFKDRHEAGKRLAQKLAFYKQAPATLVVALPRGGVEVGYEVAQALSLPLEITCPRKIGAPFHEELAIGAITETGEGIFSQELIVELGVEESYIQEAVEKEKKEANRRLHEYRQGRAALPIKGQQIILVDDGLATGSTMRAAIRSIQAQGPAKIIVAIPVAPPSTIEKIQAEVDAIICLATPSTFFAVGQFYDSFDQTTDQTVQELLKKIDPLRY